jgi:hypothetical protein
MKMMDLIKDALEGKIDKYVSSETTGECKVNYTEARLKMTEIIKVI